jgi:lysozyme
MRRRRKKNSPFYYVIGGVILLIVIGFIVRKWFVTETVPSAAVLGNRVFGVDVSQHSGTIKWDKLRKKGVEFAYIKATEGEDYVDPLYYQNYTGAKINLIVTGSYHFFRFNKDGRKQAEHFIRKAKLKKGDLLPVVDVETWGNERCNRPDAEIITELGKFLTTFETSTGIRPIIYTNVHTYTRFIKERFHRYPLWLCYLKDDEPEGDFSHWLFWQYTHKGKIEGARHPIDFNLFRYPKPYLLDKYVIGGLGLTKS